MSDLHPDMSSGRPKKVRRPFMLVVDVLVIGAGPAGSSAAKHAALNGAEVLMIDKKSVVYKVKSLHAVRFNKGLHKLQD